MVFRIINKNFCLGLLTVRCVRAYSPFVLLGRGASSGDVPKMEQDAAPAGEARNLALGRSRAPVRRHDDRLPSMAGRGGAEGERKLAG